MQLENLTSEEFEALRKEIKTVIIPVGVIESHGPHLPLGTDVFTIYETCKLLVKEVKTFLAPPLFYGLCRSTKHLPGTLTLRGETLKNLLFDLLESLYFQGMRRFVILSGHAGGTHNAFLIDTAEAFLEKYKDARFIVADILKLLKESLKDFGIPESDSHAGEWETSLMLYLKGELVKSLDKAFEDYPTFPKYQVVREKEKYWASGIWGNPHQASFEKGKLLTFALLAKLKDLLREL